MTSDTERSPAVLRELEAIRKASQRAVNDSDYEIDPHGTLDRHLNAVLQEDVIEDSTYATEDRRSGLVFQDEPGA